MFGCLNAAWKLLVYSDGEHEQRGKKLVSRKVRERAQKRMWEKLEDGI